MLSYVTLRLSGTFSTHFCHPLQQKLEFYYTCQAPSLGTRFNILLKFLTCIRCLLLTYLLIFCLVFLYLTPLKACQILSRIVTAFTSKEETLLYINHGISEQLVTRNNFTEFWNFRSFSSIYSSRIIEIMSESLLASYRYLNKQISKFTHLRSSKGR